MYIGLNFNYWMVILPVLICLGAVIGYNLVRPGKSRPLRRPFHWKSDTPAKLIMLAYATIVGIVIAKMIAVESSVGVVEFLGGSDLAWALQPYCIAAFGVVVAIITVQLMISAYRHHVKRLKHRAMVRRTKAAIKANEEAQKETSAIVAEYPDVDTFIAQLEAEGIIKADKAQNFEASWGAEMALQVEAQRSENRKDPDNVIQVDFRKQTKVNHFRNFWSQHFGQNRFSRRAQAWRGFKKGVRERIQRFRSKRDPMTLSKETVRYMTDDSVIRHKTTF